MNKASRINLLACVLLAGCAPLLAAPAPPTLDPGLLNSIVAQTANAASTQTASFRIETPTSIPTSTLLITTTPSEVPSVTPTFRFILSTPTKPSPTSSSSDDDGGSGGGGGGDYDCDVLSLLPKNNTVYSPKVDFDTRWQVRNTGDKIWDKDNIDYRFASGDKLHKQAIYDLPKDVPVGKQVDIVVDMKSPANAGSYSTTWNLRIGQQSFCNMKLTIIVE